jgi:prevent-host-death family protein
MNTLQDQIVPITEARGKLGDLADRAQGDSYFVLTKGGEPTVALVDIAYLTHLEQEVRTMYAQTFLNKETIARTRDFTTTEIEDWKKVDEL